MKGPTLRTLNRPPKYQAPPIGLTGGSSSIVSQNSTFVNVNVSGDLTVLGDTSLGDLSAGTIFGSSFSTPGRVADIGVVNADEIVANDVTAVGLYSTTIDVNTAGVVDLNLSGNIVQTDGTNELADTHVAHITQSDGSTISQTGTGENVFKNTRVATLTQTATHNILQSGSGKNVFRDSVIGVIEQYAPHNIVQYSTGTQNELRSTAITGSLNVSGNVDTNNLTCQKITADTTVEATTRLRINGKNVFGLTSATVPTTFSINNGGLINMNLNAQQGRKYMMFLSVTFDATSNGSVWRFQGSNRLYSTASSYVYEPHPYSPSLKYSNDLMTISWSYVFITGTTTYGATSDLCPLYLTCWNTASPSTAKSGYYTVQLLYLDNA